MKTVVITHEPVELFKLLKFEGLVGSGGEAKFVVSQGLVKLNGEVERQKRKKILAGDTIEFNDQLMSIVLQPST
ncbi:MAG: ribosome-associated protein [Arenicella sp.]|jgi:ribosome-associated protein